jgi:uncharacterized phosphosugar-binding protein
VRWTDQARRILDDLDRTQQTTIERASQIAARSIGAGGLVHAFGTGHSRIPIEELFPRYGSYPGFSPLAELSMTFHTQVVGANGQRQAMFIERVEGLAEVILANFELRPRDSMIIFSATGLNAVPVEMAMGARKAGLPVIAVTSLAASRSGAARHSSGTKLSDHADVVIDLCTPVGDALCAIPGLDTPVGPGSTLAAVAIVNDIKVRTAELLVAAGRMPSVLTSGQLIGAERSAELFEDAYLDHAARAAAALRKKPFLPGQEL